MCYTVYRVCLCVILCTECVYVLYCVPSVFMCYTVYRVCLCVILCTECVYFLYCVRSVFMCYTVNRVCLKSINCKFLTTLVLTYPQHMFHHTNDVLPNVRIIIYSVSGRLQMCLIQKSCIWQLKATKRKCFLK